jgi:hypothetical protein
MASFTTPDNGLWFAWRESADGASRERFFCWTQAEALQRALEWLKASEAGEKVGTGLTRTGDTPEVRYPL